MEKIDLSFAHRNSLDYFSVISDRLIAEFLTDSPSFVFILVDLISVHASNYRLLAIYFVTFDYSNTMISFMSQVKAACFQKGACWIKILTVGICTFH